jgi:hypothetical protein
VWCILPGERWARMHLLIFVLFLLRSCNDLHARVVSAVAFRVLRLVLLVLLNWEFVLYRYFFSCLLSACVFYFFFFKKIHRTIPCVHMLYSLFLLQRPYWRAASDPRDDLLEFTPGRYVLSHGSGLSSKCAVGGFCRG